MWRRFSCILAVAGAAAMAPFLGCQKEGNAPGSSSAVQPSAVPAPTAASAETPMAFLDTPAEGGVTTATVGVLGWALDSSGIAQVTVAVDGQNSSSAMIGLSHPGVADAHPGIPGNDRAGFAIEIPGLPKGPHSLSVTVVAKSGGKTEIHRQFEVK